MLQFKKIRITRVSVFFCIQCLICLSIFALLQSEDKSRDRKNDLVKREKSVEKNTNGLKNDTMFSVHLTE
jgi:hypothetical protein